MKTIKIFIDNYNFVLEFLKSVQGVLIVKDVLSADIVIVADEHQNGKSFIKQAKELNIPSAVMQHGHLATRAYLPPFNYPMIADNIFVWGEQDYNNMLLAGCPREKITITGTALFCDFIKTPMILHDGINISFFPIKFRDIEHHFEILNALIGTGYNIIVKLLPYVFDIVRFNKYVIDYPRCSLCISQNPTEAINIINRSDIMVSSYDGTPTLMACCKNIPIVSVDLGLNNLYSDVGSLVKDCSQISDAIGENIEDRNKYELKRKRMAKTGINLDGNAIANIMNKINELIIRDEVL